MLMPLNASPRRLNPWPPRWLLALLLALGARAGLGQVSEPAGREYLPYHCFGPGPDGAYPELPGGGGNRAIVEHIQRHIVWPTINGKTVPVEGQLFVSFTVGLDGRARDIKVLKGLHPLLDAETVRAVRALPPFTPGRQNGQPSEMPLTLPITFRLE